MTVIRSLRNGSRAVGMEGLSQESSLTFGEETLFAKDRDRVRQEQRDIEDLPKVAENHGGR